MTTHLIKLAVGPKSFDDLENWQKHAVCEKSEKSETTELMHITRNTPKRADEILNGGSIYWVIKGVIAGRNRILDVRSMLYQGVPHCGIVYEPTLIRVSPQPRRPFQGWRYFEEKDIPADLPRHTADIPEAVLRELSALGVI